MTESTPSAPQSKVKGLLLLAGKALLLAFVVFQLLSVTVFDPEQVSEWLFGPTRVSTRQVSEKESMDPRVHAVMERISEGATRTALEGIVGSGVSRAVGYEGLEEAAAYVEDRFIAAGLTEVRHEDFPVVVPVDKGGQITILADGQVDGSEIAFPLHALWPNNIQTSTLPLVGLEGELVYAGTGEFQEFNGRTIDGSIVLMDFASRKRFLNALMLGATAIVFIDDGRVTRSEAEDKFMRIPVDVPRFYVDRKAAETLVRLGSSPGNRVRLNSRMSWTEVKARNIFGYLPGNRSVAPESTLVISAYYDANSVAPGMAPGAEQAASIAALLTLADAFSEVRPELPIMFLATSAHFADLSGIKNFLYRHTRQEDDFLEKIPQEDRIDFGLMLALDLSSHSSQIATFAQGTYFGGWNTDPRRTNMHTAYGKAFMRYAKDVFKGDRTAAQMEAIEELPQFADAVSPAKRTWRSFMALPLAFETEPVNFVGKNAMTLASTNDLRERVDTPVDTLGAVDVVRLTGQIRTIAGLLMHGLADPGFFQETRIKPKDTGRDLKGRVLLFDRSKGFMPNTPVPGAIVTLESSQKTAGGVRMLPVTLATGMEDGEDAAGQFYFRMIAQSPTTSTVTVLAYKIDEPTGQIVYAPDLGQEGDKTYPIEINVDAPLLQTLTVLFPCRSLSLLEIVDSRYLSALDVMTLLGADNVQLHEYSSVVIPLQAARERNVVSGSVVFAKPGTRVKILMSTSLFGIKYLLINAPDELFSNPITPAQATPEMTEYAQGSGYPIESGVVKYPAYRVARDMWVVDDVRMKTLTRYGVTNERMKALHDEAYVALNLAATHLENQDYDKFISESRRAWGLEARAYPDVKGTAIDTVQGVVFYFALLLPFAFFMERMVIGAVKVRTQIIGFAGIFFGVFFVLQLVHPAFKLSTSPYIVFLGFVIFALGITVTIIVVSKFNRELQKMKRSSTGMHEVDIGRVQATAAAIMLGVNNLRKRPMRSGLTAVTLALLTFSVLSFTSVVTSLEFYKISRDNHPPYVGALVRDRNWNGLQESALDYVSTAFSSDRIISPRAWFVSHFKGDKGYVDLINDSTGNSTFASALLGLTAQEKHVTRVEETLIGRSRWFVPGDTRVLILPDLIARLAGVDSSDIGTASLRMLGTSWRVIGIYDSKKFAAMPGMDDELLTPVDLVSEAQRMAEASKEDPTQAATAPIQSFSHIDPANVVMAPYHDVREVGGTLNAVAVAGFDGPESMLDEIEAFMSRVALTVFVGTEEDVKVYSSIGMTGISGLGNLGVPIIIAALIVLNTMLGAVYDRHREIAIFATIGLTPSHIASLFIAEAAVYAVLGAVWGYLTGQVLAIILTGTDMLAGLSLNYSSLSAVASTMIVMIVVLLSAVYPAKVAADSAVPDVTRRWSFPPADGDNWQFDFPFTVGRHDVVGLYTYLARVLESYGEGSAGAFVTSGVALELLSETDEGAEDEPGYRLTFRTWLAPYDLGISQDVQMDALPTGEGSIYKIAVSIHRLSGDVASWQRINRGFMNVLRKRFLVWRTISHDIKSKYMDFGEDLFSGKVDQAALAEADLG